MLTRLQVCNNILSTGRIVSEIGELYSKHPTPILPL